MLTRDHCFIRNFFNKTFPFSFSDVKVKAGRKAEKAKKEANKDKSSRRHFIDRFSDKTIFFVDVKSSYLLCQFVNLPWNFLLMPSWSNGPWLETFGLELICTLNL